MDKLLDVRGLSVIYETNWGTVRALDKLNLEIQRDQLLAIVGESGCGKSTLGLSIIGLLPRETARIAGGSIHYKGTDLARLDQKQLRQYRGTQIAMIFQEPLTSLNPVYKVENQMAEAILVRKQRQNGELTAEGEFMQKTYKSSSTPIQVSKLPRWGKVPENLRREMVEWLKLVRIADPEQVLDRYPFELSGGMRQRIMIATALSQEPELLIADEPTTALDVTTQAQVLKLMRELMDKVRTSIILVTHDLAVASQVADRVIVMYAGEIVEDASVYDLFSKPFHPYTKGLLSCIPVGSKESNTLDPIPGNPPDLRQPATCCRYTDRCPFAMQVCRAKRPYLIETEERHEVSCFLYGK